MKSLRVVTAVLLIAEFGRADQPPGLWNLTTPELIQHFGYPSEIHHVTTSDGYILELHRIPHGIMDNSTKTRPVVFLNHCLLCSSSDYLMNTPDKAIGYQLADAGYDVWLGNFRGNTYSRRHETLSPDNIKFWAFTWNEMGLIDLPTMIDYVLINTGNPTLKLVGFSMGTTTTFTMLSELPQYNERISVAALMAPVAYVTNMGGLMKELLPYMPLIDLVATELGEGDFFPSVPAFQNFVDKYCDSSREISLLCVAIISDIAGFDMDIMNKAWLPIILSHTPAGTSYHTINHYAQVHATEVFRKYDYGPDGNMAHYGTRIPPTYNLSNVKLPVGLFSGPNDYLAAPADVARLAHELPNVVVNKQIDWAKFNHLDFVWSTKAPELVNPLVMDFIAKY